MGLESGKTGLLSKTQLKKLRRRQNQATLEANRLLRLWKDQQRHKYPSEDRLEQAAIGKPLPGVKCEGDECDGKDVWPSGYMVTCKKGRRGEVKTISYECYIHSLPESYLKAKSCSFYKFLRGKKFRDDSQNPGWENAVKAMEDQ